MASRPARALPHLPGKSRAVFISISRRTRTSSRSTSTRAHDGYVRDRCVFRADIEIEDTMNAMVPTHGADAQLFAQRVQRVGLLGGVQRTKGRLEHAIVESVYVNGTETGRRPSRRRVRTRVIPLAAARARSRPARGGPWRRRPADAGGYFPAGERGGQVCARRTNAPAPARSSSHRGQPQPGNGREGARGPTSCPACRARLCADATRTDPLPCRAGCCDRGGLRSQSVLQR